MRASFVITACICILGSGLLGIPGLRAESDLIGLYTTDDGGTVATLFTDTPGQAVEIYLMLLDPGLGGVSAWECRVEIDGRPLEDGVGDYVAPNWDLNGGLNVAESSLGLFNVGLGIGEHALRPGAGGAVLLATFSCIVIDTDSHVALTITPYPGSVTFPHDTGPGYVDPDDINTIRPLTIARTPAFTINHVPMVTAGFTADPDTSFAPTEIAFISTSTGPVEHFAWDFDDGQVSDRRNPLHAYATPGLYDVSLTVTGPDNSDTVVRTVNVEDPTVVADFSFSADGIYAPLAVDFVNLSTGEIVYQEWDFGDGTTSGQIDGVHTFTAPGAYDVTLTITGTINTHSTTRTITVSDPSVSAAFTVAPDTLWSSLPVFFSDVSTGPVMSRYWRFGDSGYSTSPTPMHIYRNPGDYTVRLTVSGPGEPDTAARTVTVHDARVYAAFTADPPTGTAPLEVAFANESHGEIRSFAWDLGDGTTSTGIDPVHTYAFPGEYPVQLVVSGPADPDTATTTIYVSGEPTSPAQLSWSPAPGFIDDGVAPDEATPGRYDEFRVVYTQADNIPPAPDFPRVLLDRNGDGDTDDPGEGNHGMWKVYTDDTYIDGCEYVSRLWLDIIGDYRHRFEAPSLGGLPAEGEPTQWHIGPIVELVAAPDLQIPGNSVMAFPLEWPVQIGMPVVIGASVENLGGVAATATLRISYEDLDEQLRTIEEFPVSLDAAGDENDAHFYQTTWNATQLEIMIHFDVVDVVPEDIDLSNNHRQSYLTDEVTSLLADGFRAASLGEGVELSWSASSEVRSFHIERRIGDKSDWRRLTREPIRSIASGGFTDYSFLDTGAEPGATAAYRLLGDVSDAAMLDLGIVEIEHAIPLPNAVSLSGNYPNPFNPSTRIDLSLPHPQTVHVGIYDAGGRLVKRLAGGPMSAGVHVLEWDGTDLGGGRAASGAYFCRLLSETRTQTVKLLLLK